MGRGEALREAIRAAALDLGFARVGFTTAYPLGPTHERRWDRWRALGRAGVMHYLLRAHPRRTHPRDLLPEARTAIVVAAGYWQGDHPPAPIGAGKIARYAWGADYHHVVRARLDALAARIQTLAAGPGAGDALLFRPCVDSAPLDERALAVRAGIGFAGKHTLVIDPAGGSWLLLGVLLTSLALPPDRPLRSATASCGACRRCLEACPTGAIESPWQLDPRRCISYLTIESRDPVPEELAPRLAGWAFGCDICQEVCPFNARPLATLLPGLEAAGGAGAFASGRMLAEARSGKGFLKRWGHTPLARAGLKGVRRSLEALGLIDETRNPE